MMHRYASTCRNGPAARRSRQGQEVLVQETLRARLEGGRDEDGIRRALVSRVRKEIAAGVYDTPEKFELALERMLGRLGQDLEVERRQLRARLGDDERVEPGVARGRDRIGDQGPAGEHDPRLLAADPGAPPARHDRRMPRPHRHQSRSDRR